MMTKKVKSRSIAIGMVSGLAHCCFVAPFQFLEEPSGSLNVAD